jgi:hypothetical protein
MTRIKVSLSIILLPFVVTSCVTGEAIKTGSTYPATTPDLVKVLFEKPTRSYEILGQVTSAGAKLSSNEANITMLRTQAAKLGADAVIVQGIGVQQVQNWGTYNTKASSGLAIKYNKSGSD